MPRSTEYQCGECRHRFLAPEGASREARLPMCPACGSIDLNLITEQRTPAVVWTSIRPAATWVLAPERARKAS